MVQVGTGGGERGGRIWGHLEAGEEAEGFLGEGGWRVGCTDGTPPGSYARSKSYSTGSTESAWICATKIGGTAPSRPFRAIAALPRIREMFFCACLFQRKLLLRFLFAFHTIVFLLRWKSLWVFALSFHVSSPLKVFCLISCICFYIPKWCQLQPTISGLIHEVAMRESHMQSPGDIRVIFSLSA